MTKVFPKDLPMSMPTVHCDHEGDPFAGGKDCVFCGRCLDVCPLFTATGREELSPRAKFTMQRLMRGVQNDDARKAVAKLVELCLSCGRCEKACPFELCGPHLVGEMRKTYPDWEQRVWKLWIEKGAGLWPALSAAARFLPDKSLGKRAEPMLAKLKTVGKRGITEPWIRVSKWDTSAAGEKAVIFPGCVAENLRGSWTEAAEKILRGLGYEVLKKPDFTCCACTLGHAGLKERQTELQRHNYELWKSLGRPNLIAFCATCRCGLRSYAGQSKLAMPEEDKERWMHSVKPLADILGKTEFDVLEEKAPATVLFHTPCHGSGGGWDAALIERMAGPRLHKSSTNHCCGMGGILQLSGADLSAQVAGQLWEHLDPAAGTQVLTACSGCVTQLAATAPTGVQVGHWLEVIED
jgi:glycolate oxidase iron-sulfur subunit